MANQTDVLHSESLAPGEDALHRRNASNGEISLKINVFVKITKLVWCMG